MSTGQVELNGMVLMAAPAGEYDRRIVLLTKERGKITAFARGARKVTSALMAATVPFAFGKFKLYEGRSAYTCVAAEISSYFDTLKQDYMAVCLGSYFMEFAAYYAQENLEAGDMLNLLYAGLRTLEKGTADRETVRCAFEVRLMVMGGEFPVSVTQEEALSESARYAFYHMITAPVGRLFSFSVSDAVKQEILQRTEQIRKRTVDRAFRSLDVLEGLK